MMTPSYIHLESFFFVARHGGYQPAADATGKQASNLCSQVRRLERMLGVRLFETRHKKYHLTPAGKRLLFLISPFFSSMSHLENIVKGGAGTLTFAATQSLLIYKLRPIIKIFRRKFRDTNITVMERRWNEMLELVDEGIVDFAITPVANVPRHIVFHEWFKSKHALIVPKDHPLADHQHVTLEEITKYPLLMYEKDELAQRRIESAIATRGLRYDKSFEATNTVTVVQYVLDRLGIAIIPTFALEQQPMNKRLRIFDMTEFFGCTPVGVIRHKDKNFSLHCQEFLKSVDPKFSFPT